MPLCLLVVPAGCDDSDTAPELPHEAMGSGGEEGSGEESSGEEPEDETPSAEELQCQEPATDDVTGSVAVLDDGFWLPVSDVYWGEAHRLESGELEISLSSRAYEPCKALHSEGSEIDKRELGVKIELDEGIYDEPRVGFWTSLYNGRSTSATGTDSVHGSSWSGGSEGHAEVRIDCPFELANLDELAVGSQVSGHVDFWYRDSAPIERVEVDIDFSVTYCGDQLPWDG